MEVIDMQNGELPKMVFKEMDLKQFYKYLSEEKYSQSKPYARVYLYMIVFI